MAKQFMPESRYKITRLENVQNPPLGKIVHVQSQELVPAGLLVYGEDFQAIIPNDQLTIYPNEKEKIGEILSKRTTPITAKIINVSGMIELSRKAAMEEALETLEIGSIVPAKILNFQNSIHFLDIGCGISAILPVSEITSTHISPDEIAERFRGFDSINVKILKESNSHKNKFIVSYKKVINPIPLQVGDIVKGRCSNFLADGSGIFIEISSIQSGICDLGIELKHLLAPGYTYSFRVKRVRPKHDETFHYSLEFVE